MDLPTITAQQAVVYCSLTNGWTQVVQAETGQWVLMDVTSGSYEAVVQSWPPRPHD